MTTWIDGLPGWAKIIVLIAVATAIATSTVNWLLPNPTQAAVEQHVRNGFAQTELLRLICHRLSVTGNFGECDRIVERH